MWSLLSGKNRKQSDQSPVDAQMIRQNTKVKHGYSSSLTSAEQSQTREDSAETDQGSQVLSGGRRSKQNDLAQEETQTTRLAPKPKPSPTPPETNAGQPQTRDDNAETDQGFQVPNGGRRSRRDDLAQGGPQTTQPAPKPKLSSTPPQANAEKPSQIHEENSQADQRSQSLHGGKRSKQHAQSNGETQTTRQPAGAKHGHSQPQMDTEKTSQIREGNTNQDRGHPQIPDESPSTVDIEDLETDDVVIAIMGPTGAGKSTFIRSASGRETQGVGHELKSFTSQVLAIKYWDQEYKRNVVLVDTPGFDDTLKSDLEILNMISDWLNSSYKKKKLLSGILYFHRITDNRMAGTPLKNLRVFRKLCGNDALDKVYLTTTMWDEVDPQVGVRRLDELSTDYWKAMIDQGAQIACCRSDDDSPKKLVQRILAQEDSRKALLLQEEMTELKKELRETAAGQQLYSQLETLVEKQMELLKRIGQERKAAADAKVLVELQAEYDDLRAQIDEKLRQMQQLKLSLFQNIRRFFSRK